MEGAQWRDPAELRDPDWQEMTPDSDVCGSLTPLTTANANMILYSPEARDILMKHVNFAEAQRIKSYGEIIGFIHFT